MSLKFCPKCGGKLDEDMEFCSYCGADLRERIKIAQSGSSPQSKKEVPPITHEPPKTTITEDKKKDFSDIVFADFLSRFFALLIDLGMIILISFVSLIFLHRIGPIFFVLVVPLISFLYFWLLESINSGQTIGKRILKLKTVNAETFEVAGVGNYLLNNFLKFSPLILLDFIIGLLFNINDKKKRLRIFQNVSNTTVIKIK